MDQMRRFMADAAHELRTPITILRTRAEVALAQERETARDAATFQAIEREAARVGGIVGDLLTLARADSGERPVVREPLYLDDVAAGAVDAVRALATSKGITLEVGKFEEAKIAGDGALVRQLVLIVLDNAIKFTPAGVNLMALSSTIRTSWRTSAPSPAILASSNFPTSSVIPLLVASARTASTAPAATSSR